MTLVFALFSQSSHPHTAKSTAKAPRKYVGRIAIPLCLFINDVKMGELSAAHSRCSGVIMARARETEAEISCGINALLVQTHTRNSQLTDNNFFVFRGCFAFLVRFFMPRIGNGKFKFLFHMRSILAAAAAAARYGSPLSRSSKFEEKNEFI
jgi:hypothetical protein